VKKGCAVETRKGEIMSFKIALIGAGAMGGAIGARLV
jgi:hypothetical protein